MARLLITPPKKPEAPKEKTNWPAAFKDWAAGRTGFTNEELIDMFAKTFGLTPAERKSLGGVLKPEAPKPTAPRPPVSPAPAIPKQPTEKPDLIIERTPYPKWWKDQRAWNIDISDAGTHVVIRPTPGWRTYIATIVLTVDGETNISFGLGMFGSSGYMDFGGTDEPRGMVIANGESPIPCGEGGFTITSDGAGVHVGGFITYYYEKG